MLRLVVLLLLLANAGFYAWSQGLLTGVLPWPPDAREPERLHRQVNPDAIRIVTTARGGTATPSAAAASAPPASSGASR